MKDNLVYNEPFEIENLVWEIEGIKYYIYKYRQIDCDMEVGYYYDFIMLEFTNSDGDKLFKLRKYNHENDMSFLCNPYLKKNEYLSHVLKILKEKYQVKDFYYLDIGKGYLKID